MTDEQDLTEMTVDEQENQLKDLNLEELKELRGREERNTAMDNIDREISNRQEDSRTEKTVSNSVNQDQESEKSELERKVDYLIEKCKTTSHEGFKDYE